MGEAHGMTPALFMKGGRDMQLTIDEKRAKKSSGVSLVMMLLWITLGASACAPLAAQEKTIVERFFTPLGPTQIPLRVLALLGGAVLCFAGWKIYRFVIAVPGLFVGAALGAQIGFRLGDSGWFALIGLALGGLLGVWLALSIHDLAIFAIGALGGIFLTASVWGLLAQGAQPLWLEVIAGIGGGVVLLAMARTWMMLLSAGVGATMLVWGIEGNVVWILVFFVLGVFVQSNLARSMGERAFDEQDASL